jgi:outer membrane protein OmpA-like peptidoglycan-associated protein
MSNSILSSLFSTIDSRSVGEIASRLGENQLAVSQGLETMTAALIGGLANKAGDSSWMGQLFKLVSQAPSNVNVSDVAASVTDPGQASASPLLDSGRKLMSLAFGGSQASVLDALGKHTGLRPSVVSSLMGIAAPLLMSGLGRLVREDHMGQAGLSSLLTREAEGVRSHLPSGFSNLLNAATAPMPDTGRPRSISTVTELEPERRSRGWLWLIPALLLLIPLLYWANRSRQAVVPQVRGFVARVLPNNVSLNIPANGMEARLLAFIQDPTKSADQVTWIDFDRLLFDTDSATLRPESQEQLGNIAAILQAYPNVHVKIGGYTDNIGDAQHNLQLSQDRANGVMAELVALGISGDRMEAQGYGEQFPVGDNSSAEGRAKNRRISMRVTQK